jgi:hypothetical protein
VQIIDFSDHAEAFAKENCVLIGASVDSEYSHLAWMVRRLCAAAAPLHPPAPYAVAHCLRAVRCRKWTARKVVSAASTARSSPISNARSALTTA